MTARSTRRAAEMELIDAALGRYAVLADQRSTASQHQAASQRLHNACVAYERMGLDATSQPAFSHNSTDTSAEAGASMNTHVGRLARQCFDEIGAVYRNGGVGLTVDQLEQVMHGKHQTISARVNELRNKGWLADAGIKRPTRSGRPAIVWTPTVQALYFL